MSEDNQRLLIKELRDGNMFNFVGNHGHEFSKFELCDLIKELDYGIYHECGIDKKMKMRIYNVAADSLEERWCLNEEEEED